MTRVLNRTKGAKVNWWYAVKVLGYAGLFGGLCWAIWGRHSVLVEANTQVEVPENFDDSGWCMEDVCEAEVNSHSTAEIGKPASSDFTSNVAWLVKDKKAKITLMQNQEPITFEKWIRLMQSNNKFVDVWFRVFDQLPFAYPGLFFEVPPMTPKNLHRAFECVIIDAPKFESFRSSPRFFEAYFTAPAPATFFTNLGGDSTLISPNPLKNQPLERYTHLGIFMAKGSKDQKRGFWKLVAEKYEEKIAEGKPVWLSTEGSGVYYLHMRLDPRPKYYHHAPYKNPKFFSR